MCSFFTRRFVSGSPPDLQLHPLGDTNSWKGPSSDLPRGVCIQPRPPRAGWDPVTARRPHAARPPGGRHPPGVTIWGPQRPRQGSESTGHTWQVWSPLGKRQRRRRKGQAPQAGHPRSGSELSLRLNRFPELAGRPRSRRNRLGKRVPDGAAELPPGRMSPLRACPRGQGPRSARAASPGRLRASALPERASGPGQVRTRPRRTWRGRQRPALLAGPGTRGTGPASQGGARAGGTRARARPREAGAAGDGGVAPRRAPQLAPNLQSRFGGGAAHLAAGPTGSPDARAIVPSPRPPTYPQRGPGCSRRGSSSSGGGGGAGDRGGAATPVLSGAGRARRAHSTPWRGCPGSSRGSGRPAASPPSAAGPGRRGRREEARERKPSRVSAPRRRRAPPSAPRAGRALRAPPGGRPARGELRRAGLAPLPAPPALGPGAGTSREAQGRAPGLHPAGPGARSSPETGVLLVRRPGPSSPGGETEARDRGVRKGCPGHALNRQFQGWKPRGPEPGARFPATAATPAGSSSGRAPTPVLTGEGPGKATTRQRRG